MDHRPVLDVGPVADGDRIDVAAQDGVEPDRTVAAVVTSPISTAVSATNVPSPTRGVCPRTSFIYAISIPPFRTADAETLRTLYLAKIGTPHENSNSSGGEAVKKLSA